MKVVDVFANMAEQMVDDAQVRRYGTILLTQGARGVGKLNPTVVWVDAAIAVLEATASYLRFCEAREVTTQLREFNKTLEATLAQDLRIGEKQLQQLQRERSGRKEQIAQVLKLSNQQKSLTLKKVRQQLDTLKRVHVLLQKERQDLGNFQQLIGLQVCLDQCIDATLALLLTPTGENA
jgi:hypothetical protein